MRARLLLLAALVAVAAFATLAQPAYAGPLVDRAVRGLESDPVYVDPAAESELADAEASELRDRIAAGDGGPIYIAVLPDEARNEAGGDSGEVLRTIAETLRRPGTYAAVVGDQFRAGSTALAEGEASALATQSFEEHQSEGPAATLLAFIDLVGQARNGAEPAGGAEPPGEGPSLVGLGGLAVIGGGAAGLLALRRRRRNRRELEEVKEFARDDLVALGDDIRALDLDVEMPDADPAAKEDYGRAVTRYDEANQAFERARRPEDIEPVTAALEEGRFAMASAKARFAGQEPPERRPPCFFDPRHGPSVGDVEWAPPGGMPRPVPACAADAQRVEEGLEPAAREVMVGGQAMPYWNAPAAYGPWAGGFFGGFGGGFLPGMFLGSMLGSGMGFGGPVYIDGDGGAGDFGDGGDFGDFGGGDFGGGDFGGGDFGGGDFGGGGDF